MSGRDHRDRQPAPDEGLWVRSDVMPDGSYAVTVSLDKDHTRKLTPTEAVAYALTVLQVVQTAEHDAAVLRLLTIKVHARVEEAGRIIVQDLRPDRRPADETATAPWTFTPGVRRDGKPFIILTANGTPAGQVGLTALRQHALHVLEAPVAVDLDTGLRRVLTRNLGLDSATAGQVVGDLANWRWQDPDA